MWVGLRYTLVERAIIMVHYHNIPEWYNMFFSLRCEVDVVVDGVGMS